METRTTTVWPDTHGPKRDEVIFNAVLNGEAEVKWSAVESKGDGITGTFFVFSDALKVAGVRVNASADLSQQIAWAMGCSLLTAKLADLIWAQAQWRVKPHPRAIASLTSAMIEHSNKIENDLTSLGYTGSGIVSTVGKHWLIDNDIKAGACNYGWHATAADFHGGSLTGIPQSMGVTKDPTTNQYYPVIQSRGFAHDKSHVDYSQTLVLVSNLCIINGTGCDLRTVLTDLHLSPLVSHQGPLKILQQPGAVRKTMSQAFYLPEDTIKAGSLSYYALSIVVMAPLPQLLHAVFELSPLAEVQFVPTQPPNKDRWSVRVSIGGIEIFQTKAADIDTATKEATDKLQSMSQRMMHAINEPELLG